MISYLSDINKWFGENGMKMTNDCLVNASKWQSISFSPTFCKNEKRGKNVATEKEEEMKYCTVARSKQKS